MEDIISFLGVLLLIDLLYLRATFTKKLFGMGKAATRAAKHASEGDGDFGEKFKESFRDEARFELKGMQPMELRGTLAKPVPDSDIQSIELSVRGLFPNVAKCQGIFVSSVFDITEPDAEGKLAFHPVLSTYDRFQEDDTLCFQFRQDVGDIEANYGYKRWARVGVIVPEFLQPPKTGTRKFRAFVRLLDSEDPPDITQGYHDDASKVLWTGVYDFTWTYSKLGWVDEIVQNREAASLVVKIAVAVATVDGSFDDAEGNEIKKWMRKKISILSGGAKEDLKNAMNAAFKEAFMLAESGQLSYSSLTSALREKNSLSASTECIDLIYAVISADGVAAPQEMALAKQIAAALDINPDEVKNIADSALVSVNIVAEQGDELESALGIDSSLSPAEVRKYLRGEFQKWNNRLNTVSEGPEREAVQYRLGLIAKAREKYKE